MCWHSCLIHSCHSDANLHACLLLCGWRTADPTASQVTQLQPCGCLLALAIFVVALDFNHLQLLLLCVAHSYQSAPVYKHFLRQAGRLTLHFLLVWRSCCAVILSCRVVLSCWAVVLYRHALLSRFTLVLCCYALLSCFALHAVLPRFAEHHSKSCHQLHHKATACAHDHSSRMGTKLHILRVHCACRLDDVCLGMLAVRTRSAHA